MYIPDKLIGKFKGQKPWLLFLYLLFKANKKGRINTSYREMQADTGFSARCVHAAIKDMEKMGALSVETSSRQNRSDKQGSTIITICNYEFYSMPNTEAKRDKLDYSFVEPVLKEAFGEWLKYKRSKNQMYKTQDSLEACYKNMKMLSKCNAETAMKIVNQSKANNWAGLFELKGNEKRTNNYRASAENKAASRAALESLADAILEQH